MCGWDLPGWPGLRWWPGTCRSSAGLHRWLLVLPRRPRWALGVGRHRRMLLLWLRRWTGWPVAVSLWCGRWAAKRAVGAGITPLWGRADRAWRRDPVYRALGGRAIVWCWGAAARRLPLNRRAAVRRWLIRVHAEALPFVSRQGRHEMCSIVRQSTGLAPAACGHATSPAVAVQVLHRAIWFSVPRRNHASTLALVPCVGSPM